MCALITPQWQGCTLRFGKHRNNGSGEKHVVPYPWLKNSPALSRESSIFFDWACGFGRDAHGTIREERETFLASRISLINHVDQGNDVLPMDYPRICLTGASGKITSSLTWQDRCQCPTLPFSSAILLCGPCTPSYEAWLAVLQMTVALPPCLW